MDDVPHNRRVVERLHGHLSSFHRLENNFGDAGVLLVLGIIQYLHLLDLPEFFAHVSEEPFPDVVVEPRERHLLGGHGADVAIVDLRAERQPLRSREGERHAPRGRRL